MEDDKLLGIQKAADFLGISTWTLRRWDNSGKFKSIRMFGGPRKYKLSDIQKIKETGDIKE